jgi:hypothetical protein
MWRFLRPRLRLIVEMQKVWGSDVHDLYSRSHSLFTFISLPPMIVDPDGVYLFYMLIPKDSDRI